MGGRRIKPRNEFWLYVHELAAAYSNEGLTSQERAESIAGWFLSMPSVVRPELLADLDLILRQLPDVRAIVTAAQHQPGSSKWKGEPEQIALLPVHSREVNS